MLGYVRMTASFLCRGYIPRPIENKEASSYIETKTYNFTARVPQAYVLDLLLWNIITLEIPQQSTIHGFAYDIAVIVM